jgi:pteridine reductase
MNIQGKTVVITGAKRIGKTVAKELAKKGANLAIIYNSSKAEALEVVEDCRGTGVNVEIFQANLSNEDDIKRVVGEVVDKFGSIHGLVNMAAPYPKSPLGEINLTEFDKTMRAIAGSAILLGQEIGLKMNEGRIIFFSDWSVLRNPFKNYLVYNAAKASIDSITKELAAELAPKVLVNAIAPGPILKPPDLTDEEDAEVMAKTPLARWGGAEEIAKAVNFFFESDFVTGVVLPVDGGRSIV